MSDTTEFTLDDLIRILRSCSGDDEALDPDRIAVDEPFAEIGYDSLAILELAGQVQRIYGVVMPDEAVAHMATPRDAVEYVGTRLQEVTA